MGYSIANRSTGLRRGPLAVVGITNLFDRSFAEHQSSADRGGGRFPRRTAYASAPNGTRSEARR